MEHSLLIISTNVKPLRHLSVSLYLLDLSSRISPISLFCAQKVHKTWYTKMVLETFLNRILLWYCLFGWTRMIIFGNNLNNELLTGLGATAAAFKNTTPPSFERKENSQIYRLGLCLPIQNLIFTHIIQHTLWAAGINYTHVPTGLHWF